MADINDVLERLVTDPSFRQALRVDPERALKGYELTDAGRELLAAQISEGAGAGGAVEQRTSKSALAGWLVGSAGIGPAPSEDASEIQDGTSNTIMVGETTESAEGRASDDVVIKGKKILENAEEDPSLITPEPESDPAIPEPTLTTRKAGGER